jgi:hypothetical protein
MFKAKQIVENKFWILESNNGTKVGTVKVNNNKVTATIEDKPETFSSFEELMGKYSVSFVKRVAEFKQEEPGQEVYGYPSKSKPHNALWNVQMRVPIYTKTEKSSSYHCAGHYIIRFSSGWVKSFSPKLLTLQRYPFKGPFMTNQEAIEQMRLANEAT